MKKIAKKILACGLISIFLATNIAAMFVSASTTNEFGQIEYTYEEDEKCKKETKGKEEYGNVATGITCDEKDLKDKMNKDVAAKNAEDEKEADCKQAGLSEFGSSLSCSGLANARNKKREEECQEKYKTSCAVHTDQVRSASGQNFKLPLDFLSLKTKDSDGKLKQQGKSIFVNKDYAQYGVLIGTLLRVIDIMILVIGSVALLTLVVAGIFMIANHGDEAWVTKGKGMMLYSILGLLFAFLAFALVNIITSITS